MAQPPIHVWMPNHPQATTARSNAGTLAPRMPNAARQYTGNGMPYLVPTWPFRIIGTRAMMLARTMVSTACHQFMPSSISDDASMYVGTQAAMATHSAAMSRRRHLRWAVVVGARSGLKYGEAAISPRGSSPTPDEAARSITMAASYSVPAAMTHDELLDDRKRVTSADHSFAAAGPSFWAVTRVSGGHNRRGIVSRPGRAGYQ